MTMCVDASVQTRHSGERIAAAHEPVPHDACRLSCHARFRGSGPNTDDLTVPAMGRL
jgi:hypothetical protein